MSFELQFTRKGVTRKHTNRAIIHRIEKMTTFFSHSTNTHTPSAYLSNLQARWSFHANSNNTQRDREREKKNGTWIYAELRTSYRTIPIIRQHLIHTLELESTFLQSVIVTIRTKFMLILFFFSVHFLYFCGRMYLLPICLALSCLRSAVYESFRIWLDHIRFVVG